MALSAFRRKKKKEEEEEEVMKSTFCSGQRRRKGRRWTYPKGEVVFSPFGVV